MVVMRMLMRDVSFQRIFVNKLSGLPTLCSELQRKTDSYFECDGDPNVARILTEMTSEFVFLSTRIVPLVSGLFVILNIRDVSNRWTVKQQFTSLSLFKPKRSDVISRGEGGHRDVHGIVDNVWWQECSDGCKLLVMKTISNVNIRTSAPIHVLSATRLPPQLSPPKPTLPHYPARMVDGEIPTNFQNYPTLIIMVTTHCFVFCCLRFCLFVEPMGFVLWSNRHCP